jgi:hypothetical protein
MMMGSCPLARMELSTAQALSRRLLLDDGEVVRPTSDAVFGHGPQDLMMVEKAVRREHGQVTRPIRRFVDAIHL